jgi:mannose/fructose/N-acetylgalactosamine-specific phosphotransferase system component IIB
MAISFIRIDDRIIHGQITTRWSQEYPCDAIIAVNDHAASNPIIKSTFLSAIKKKTYIWTHEEWNEKKGKVLASDKNYFLITKTPQDMATILLDEAFDPGIKLIVVGPANQRPDATMIGKNQSITQDEADAFERMYQGGYKIWFALIVELAIGYWPKFRSMFGYK